MNLENKLRTPSPNKEFRRVSSRNLRKDQNNSPKSASSVRNISIHSVSNDRMGNKMALLPGSVAHKFSPSQYLGHSLSRSNTPKKSVAHTITFETNYARNIVKLNTPDPLLMSNEKLREFRHEQKAAELQQAAAANSIDYIDLLVTPSLTAKSPMEQRNAMSPMELSCGEEGSPPPPPPPPLSPSTPQSQSMESLRRLKDATTGLIAPSSSSVGQSEGKAALTPVSVPASTSIISPLRAAEEERLRRLRRIHVMLAEYQEAVRIVEADAQGGSSNYTQLWLSKKGISSAGTVEVAAEMTEVLQEWCELHSTSVAIAEERVATLTEQRSEHLQLQQELESTERALVEAGEEHRTLLEELHAAVTAAEERWDRDTLQRRLQAYPASWFQQLQEGNETDSVSQRKARSRSDSTASSVVQWQRSCSPAGTARPSSPSWASESQSVTSCTTDSAWGRIRRLSRSSAFSITGRDHSPNSQQQQRKTVDPTVLPSSENFAQPWAFKLNPEVRERLTELTVAGHRFYGPPTQERRYRETYGSGSSSTGQSRSSSTGRSISSAPATLHRSRTPSITSAGSGLTLEWGLDSDDASAGSSQQWPHRRRNSSSKLSERSTSATRTKTFAIQSIHSGSQRPSSAGRLGQGRDLRAGGPTPRFLQSTQSFLHSVRPVTAELSVPLDGVPQSQRQHANVFSACDGQIFSEFPPELEAERLTLQDLSTGSPEQGRTKTNDRQENSAGRAVRRPSSHQQQHSGRNCGEAAPSQRDSPPRIFSGLTRTPSNSAASTRFAAMHRGSSMRRYSIATNSSDASYSGSRYSDVQWDTGTQQFSLGHSARHLSNSRSGTDPGDTLLLSTDDDSAAEKSTVQTGSLIRGANNHDMSGRAYLDSMHISSSSSSGSGSASDDDQEGAQEKSSQLPAPAPVPAQCENRPHRQLGNSTRREQVAAAVPIYADITAASRSAARRVQPHYVASLHRTAAAEAAVSVPPWSAPSLNECSEVMENGFAGPSSSAPATVGRQHPPTSAAASATRGLHAAGRSTSQKQAGTLRPRPKAVRPIATPKVRMPAAAQPVGTCTQQEEQLIAQQVRVAVRAEADSYIDSLRRMVH